MYNAQRELSKRRLADTVQGLLYGPSGVSGGGIPTVYNGPELKKLRKKYRKAKY